MKSIGRCISNSKGDRIGLRLVRRLTPDRCCIRKRSPFFIIFRLTFFIRFQLGAFVFFQVGAFVLVLVGFSRLYYLCQVEFIVLIYLLNLQDLSLHLHFNK